MWSVNGDPLLGPLLHGAGLGILLPLLFVVFLVWIFAWKAIALWHAARNGQRWWFLALTVINIAGIPEIVYLKWFQKDAGAGRDHMFPFLKNVKQEMMARMQSSSASEEKKGAA